MEERMKKRAALCLLIGFVDENGGSIVVDTKDIKRVFNDEDQIVRVEYQNGNTGLLYDATFDAMDNAVKAWLSK